MLPTAIRRRILRETWRNQMGRMQRKKLPQFCGPKTYSRLESDILKQLLKMMGVEMEIPKAIAFDEV